MTVQFNGTSDGKAANISESYNVVSSTSSQLNVTVGFTSNATTESFGAVIDTNGTLLSLSLNGTTIPGSEGSLMLSGLFVGFITEAEFTDSLNNYTSGLQFHTTGSSTVSIGTVSVPVTTYAANSLPVTVSDCSGSSTLTAFSLSEGTPSGGHVAIVTSMTIAGSGTSNGTPTSFDISLAVTSITVA